MRYRFILYAFMVIILSSGMAIQAKPIIAPSRLCMGSGMSPSSWMDSQAQQWASNWAGLGVQDIPSQEVFTENPGFVNMVWGSLDPSYIPGDEFMAIDAVKSIIGSAWTQAFYLRFPPAGPPPAVLTPCETVRFNISNLEGSLSRIMFGISSHMAEIVTLNGQLDDLMRRRTNCLPEDRAALEREIWSIQSSISILNTYNEGDQAARDQLMAQIASEKARLIELGCPR